MINTTFYQNLNCILDKIGVKLNSAYRVNDKVYMDIENTNIGKYMFLIAPETINSEWTIEITNARLDFYGLDMLKTIIDRYKPILRCLNSLDYSNLKNTV